MRGRLPKQIESIKKEILALGAMAEQAGRMLKMSLDALVKMDPDMAMKSG